MPAAPATAPVPAASGQAPGEAATSPGGPPAGGAVPDGAASGGVAAGNGDAAAADGSAVPPGGPALPLPPVSPRIAQGGDYDKCLDMLSTDPAGAANFAEAWEATGGGEGATHCDALAQIALGDPAAGAAKLDTLAQGSRAPALARAALFGQADQAWLMAGDATRAYASATLALTLSSEDPELLIDRSIAAATLERYADAVDDLDRALALDPRRADALIYHAAAERHLGHLDQASDDIARAITLDPDNPDALLERGIIRQADGDLAGARGDWERTVSLVPDTATGDLAQQNLALLEAGPQR